MSTVIVLFSIVNLSERDMYKVIFITYLFNHTILISGVGRCQKVYVCVGGGGGVGGGGRGTAGGGGGGAQLHTFMHLR